jgi:acyl carrier protein
MQTQSEIIDEIAKHLGVTPADIDLHASLKDDLGLGPIEISDLLQALSTKFQITFDPSDTEELHIINDLVVMVEDLLLE